jgi:pimeloyl-ACP methyl ester carboxylesterase
VLKTFAGGRLFGGTWGSGVPTVLALHGWRRTHDDFAGVFDAGNGGDPEAAGLDAIAVDLFGFGATPPPPEPWSTGEYARHLLPLFDEPGVLSDQIVVVGHSFGGRVAVRLAGMVPDRIERMVLCGVPLLDRSDRRARPARAFQIARKLNRVGLIGDDRMEGMRKKYGSADYRAASGVMRDVLVKLLAERYDDSLSEIDCPVELLWGEQDSEVPVEVAVRAQAMLQKATLRVLSDVGHLLPTESPLELRRSVLGRASTADDGPTAGSR